MQLEQNKVVARRFIEEILGKGNFDLFPELTTREYIDHSLPSGVTPLQSLGAFRAGFPDIAVSVESLVGEGDIVVVRWVLQATHTGNFFGIPASGQPITLRGISMYRISGGKMAEGWVEYDQLGLMQQIGMALQPAQAVH
jgi:steroid delta-isomerase-like uncharacterized protein